MSIDFRVTSRVAETPDHSHHGDDQVNKAASLTSLPILLDPNPLPVVDCIPLRFLLVHVWLFIPNAENKSEGLNPKWRYKIASERSGYKCIADGLGEVFREKIAVVLGRRGDSKGVWKSLTGIIPLIILYPRELAV